MRDIGVLITTVRMVWSVNFRRLYNVEVLILTADVLHDLGVLISAADCVTSECQLQQAVRPWSTDLKRLFDLGLLMAAGGMTVGRELQQTGPGVTIFSSLSFLSFVGP